MQAKLRPNKNCGCSLEYVFFLIALHAYLKAHYANQQ